MTQTKRSRDSPTEVVKKLVVAISTVDAGHHRVNKIAKDAQLKWSVAKRYIEIIHIAQRDAPPIDLLPQPGRVGTKEGWYVHIRAADPKKMLLRIARSGRRFRASDLSPEEGNAIDILVGRHLVERGQDSSGPFVQLSLEGQRESIRLAEELRDSKKDPPEVT